GGVTGMEDVSALPRITDRLLQMVYTDKQVRGILGGNVLRVLDSVVRTSRSLRKNSK
ncbi:MAG: membrane dipeptidase, partial [Pseudoxanthomonas sp.]